MNLTEVHHKSPCSPGTGMKRTIEKLIQGLDDSMILWWTSVKFITNWGSPADLDLWWTATSFIRNSSSWPLPVPWKSSHGFNRNRIICDECDASRNFGSKALQVPSFFLHFVRTRLGGWLQSFTVTVVRLTPVCAFSVLKSTDFLCWKAQLKIALFSLLFCKTIDKHDCWPTTKKHVSSIPGEKLVPMPHTKLFSSPCHRWIPRKYTTVKLESYFLR